MQTSKKTVQQIDTNKINTRQNKKVVEYMEENNNSFLSISQVIKQLDNEYTDTEETTENIYNSNFIFEY